MKKYPKKGQYIRTEAHKEQSRKNLSKFIENGGVVWNKGLKGIHLSPKSEFKNGRKDEKHPEWKGEGASYSAKHSWVSRWLGKPKLCEDCGTIEAKNYDWANISREYKRDLSDWRRLCRKCHHRFDSISEKIWEKRHQQSV